MECERAVCGYKKKDEESLWSWTLTVMVDLQGTMFCTLTVMVDL